MRPSTAATGGGLAKAQSQAANLSIKPPAIQFSPDNPQSTNRMQQWTRPSVSQMPYTEYLPSHMES